MRFTVLCLSVLVGCSSDPSSSPGTPEPTADAAPVEPPLVWTPCDLFSEGGGPRVECARARVPLRREDPTGETIELFVKRYRPRGTPNARAAFMLQGGPGGSAYAFEKYVDAVAKVHTDIDWYLPDHRGTGKSTRLGCPEQESETSVAGFYIHSTEWKKCREYLQATWGDRLTAFSTTNAANDIGLLVGRARQEHEQVFVYGVSYGTYWATRYLQLFPTQPAGVILDSIVPPNASLARQDEDGNTAGKLLFAECAKQPSCRDRLGDDPWARATEVFAKLDTGHCSEATVPGLPLRVALRRAFGQMQMGYGLRPYIASAVYRADRCNESDVAALKHLLAIFFNEDDPGEMLRQYSFPLGNNVALSELWEDPSPTRAELAAIRNAAIASRDVTEGLALQLGLWPTYPRDEFMGKLPTTDVPLLMMHAPLDPATLLSKTTPVREHFRGKHQHFIEFANGGHSIVSSTPTREKKSCGTAVLMSFLRAPEGDPDTTCLANLLPLDFDGEPELTKFVFDRDSTWD